MMNNCKQCGKPVRLRAMKISVSRIPGVMHYVDHMDGSRMHSEEWECSMLKPYPKTDADKPYMKMIQRWDEENPS
jgi:hypothetical protein